MRAWVVLAALATGLAASAQQAVIPPAAIDGSKPLKDVDRARYLCRQLELAPDQAQHAEGLIEVAYAGGQNTIDIDRVRQVWKDLQDAINAGDKAKEEALTRELQAMGKGIDQEPEFLENLRSALTDEQKAKLGRALARLERNPSGALRPADLIEVAQDLTPPGEQRTKLTEVREAFRTEVNSRPQFDDARKLQLINGLYVRIQDELDDAAEDKFHLAVRGLRPDLGTGRLDVGGGKRGAQPEKAAETP
jgi:hypothetical protein